MLARVSYPSTPAKRTRVTRTQVSQKRRISRRVVRIPRPVYVWKRSLPEQLSNEMTYSTEFSQLMVGSAAYDDARFNVSANGLYQPITGNTSQPLYFAELSALYGRYCVTSSVIEVVATVPTTTGTPYLSPMRMVVYEEDDAAGSSSVAEAMTRPGAVYCVKNVSSSMPRLTLRFDGNKTYSGYNLSEDDLKGTPTSNPASQTYFRVHADFAGIAVTQSSIPFTIRVKYYVTWSELLTVDPSVSG